MKSLNAVRRLAAMLMALVATAPAWSQTDIATAPLVTSAAAIVKPNLMFVIDDSGSMGFDFLPDHVVQSAQGGCRFYNTTTGATTYNQACCRNNASPVVSPSSTACWIGDAPFDTYRAEPPFLSPDYNGVFYNPAVYYQPPVQADGSSYANQTSGATGGWATVKNDAYGVQSTTDVNLLTQFPDVEWCTDGTHTDCLRNGNYVLPGKVDGKNYTTRRMTVASGSGSIAVGAPDNVTTEARDFGPHYFVINPVEWCDGPGLRNCQASQSLVYRFPAKVRWCTSAAEAAKVTPAANACQAQRVTGYNSVRYPGIVFGAGSAAVPDTPEKAATVELTFTLSGTCSNNNNRRVTVSAVNVAGVDNLLTATTSLQSTASNVAEQVRLGINARNPSIGYSAVRSANRVTITAPLAAGDLNAAVTVTQGNPTSQCQLNVAAATFSGYQPFQPGTPAGLGSYPGSWERVDIVPSRENYPRASGRTDCASATTCTYNEEMTNFANWWTYYRTRMQTMKTSASLAFQPVSDRFRLGYSSLNRNATEDFLNLNTFSGTHKSTWFTKLTNARPGSGTPLRTALARTGRLYGGQLNGTTIDGVTVTEPMQYSCQQNFTLLSTDGYWNETTTPTRLDGSTAVGDIDTALPRPLFDGNDQSNTLADVAAYYYETDLRNDCGSGTDLCTNNVPTSGVDVAQHQHMTTFTLGLGVSGFMQFTPNYAAATSGDYFSIKSGAAADPSNGVCAWQSSGTCNWPIPANNSLTAVDDLWHAAITGRGTYFSASDPTTLFKGLSTALASISAQVGTAAGATTSNPNVSAGDNFLFSSTFTSVEWTGELMRQRVDIETGAVSESVDWRAQAQLDGNTSRQIYTFDPSNTGNGLKSFAWDGLSTTERANFSLAHITASGRALTQFCAAGQTCLSASAQADAAGAKLVAFLRGDRSNEGTAAEPGKYYRERVSVLGDIVDGEALYVKKPPYRYTDAGYTSYQSSKATRQGMVYVGANDGMLHAFNADTGAEVWAYVPTMVLPTLYQLADKDYANRHQFYVNASPAFGDVHDGSNWRTILVSGLGAGGRGYFAMDVTDPAAPKALWEFTYDTSKGAGYTTDANLGLSFGKPEITKLKDGTWVVIVASGYNNINPGDGRGYLYVLDAITGEMIRTIGTGVGTASAPAGLAHIRAWVDATEIDNTTQRVYGADNLGNVWRFDVNGDVGASGYDALQLATLRSGGGAVQPVTSRPELGLVAGVPLVYVGTGRFLGVSDATSSTGQSIYAIKDALTDTGVGVPRDNTSFVAQTITAGTCPTGATICAPGQTVRTGSDNAVNLAVNDGWYVDLPSGERVYSDPQLGLGTIAITSNIVQSSACTAGGSSYLNYFDYRSGAPITTASAVVSVFLGNTLASRPTLVKLPNGKVIGVIRGSDGRSLSQPIPTGNAGLPTRRVGWRGLLVD